MYCIKCGKQIPDGSSFCPSCGASQDGNDRQFAPVQHTESTSSQSIPNQKRKNQDAVA